MRTIIALCLTLAALGPLACGDDGGGDPPDDQHQQPNVEPNGNPDSGANADENIYPGVDFETVEVTADDGATIRLPSGRASLVIPAGALAEETEVTLRLVPDIAVYDGLLPDGGGGGPSPYTLNVEPAGLALSGPATISMEVTAEELSLADRNNQVWRYGLASNGPDEDTILDASFTRPDSSAELWTIEAEIDHFGDITPYGVGKIELMPDCTECTSDTEHTFVIDVENTLAPTVGFTVSATSSGPVDFTTADATGVAAPMTHEFPELTFECTEPGTATVEVAYEADLGESGPTFGWGTPLTTDITCM